jgi:hypothetical protein
LLGRDRQAWIVEMGTFAATIDGTREDDVLCHGLSKLDADSDDSGMRCADEKHEILLQR